jgi:hypothetical protein
MNVHVRIGDNRSFALKQAVLLYQEGSTTFATLHEVKSLREGAPYLGPGQSVTTGFLERLARGLGASLAAEVLPEHVLARTPEMIAWWSSAKHRLMFFGDGNRETTKLNGKDVSPSGLGVHDSWTGTVCAGIGGKPAAGGTYTPEKCSLLEHGSARACLSRKYAGP